MSINYSVWIFASCAGDEGVHRIQVRVSVKLEGESWLAAERNQSGSEGEFWGREWCVNVEVLGERVIRAVGKTRD